MKASSSDQDLVQLCLSGKDSGFRQLYERHAGPVYNSIYRLLNDMAEAEDLLQEVFVSIFSNVERLVGLDSVEAWIKRVAINKSISHLRKRRIRFIDMDTIKGSEVLAEEEPDAWQESRIEDIEQAIERLPDMAKTIVNLYLFEDLSQEEIGAALGLSHTAVRSQYHRAKSKIAQMIKEKGCYGR